MWVFAGREHVLNYMHLQGCGFSALIKDHCEMCHVFLLPQQDDGEEEENDASVSPGSKTKGKDEVLTCKFVLYIKRIQYFLE